MIKILYKNENGNNCTAIINDGTFDYYLGTYPKLKLFKKDSEYIKRLMMKALKKCKIMEVNEI